MPAGGARPGAGKPKGYKHKKTLEKEALARLFAAKVADRWADVCDATIDAAIGVQHMMARDRDGKWTEVTDPAIMARVLNSGETFYKLSARKPDVNALRELLNRQLGVPTKPVEMTGKDGGPLLIQCEIPD